MLCSALALAASLALPIQVHIVAPSGGDFSTIQAAVDAAAPGDTILVRPGSFPGFTIQSKALAIVGDGDVQVTGPIVVRGIAAGQWCSLASLRNANSIAGGMRVEFVAGSVRVVACELLGYVGDGVPALSVTNTTGNVALDRCTLVGGRGATPGDLFDFGYPGGEGVLVVGGRLAIHDCTITGGRGGDATYAPAAQGARAVEFRSAPTYPGSGVLVCGSTLTGGRGGDSYENTQAEFTSPGFGGNGLVMAAGTVAQVRDSTLVGGAPGVGIFCIPPWTPGPGLPSSGAGTFYTLPAPRLVLEAPAIVREGSTLAIRVRGVPGERAYLDTGRAPSFQAFPSAGGIDLVANPTPSRILILGEIPASGVLDANLWIPLQASSFVAQQRHVQVFSRDAGGATTLGGFGVVSVVDAAY